MALKLYRHSNDTLPGFSAIPLKQWRFPAGEAGIKIETDQWHQMYECSFDIHLHWEGNDDLMALAQLVEALRGFDATKIDLHIPYFPYARQDRRCQPGEGHALKTTGQFINSLGFNRVVVLDAHSHVLEAVVDRLTVVPQNVCARRLPKYDVLIAPDAGAAKKIMTHMQVVDGYADVLIAEKTRGPGGVITGMHIPHFDSLTDQRVCVVDDICDGGATFIAVAKAIPITHKPEVLDLYVTHGIYTKGLGELSIYYNNFYTRNLMNPGLKGQIKEI